MAADAELEGPLERFAADSNGDGQLSLGDVPGWLAALYFAPGDFAVWALAAYARPIASVLDLGADDYGGLFSGIVSGFAWLAVFIAVVIVGQFIVDLDKRVTRGAHDLASSLVLRLRISRAIWRQRWQRLLTRPPARSTSGAVEVELSTPQIVALRLYADVEPGYALSAGEVARALGTRVRPVEDLLDKLAGLGLLRRTFGTTDGSSGFTLTSAGRGVLVFKQLTRAGARPSAP